MGKPLCTKCGLEHWRFVRCAEAPARTEQDQQKAVQQEKLKVVPIYRTGNDRTMANSAPPGFRQVPMTGLISRRPEPPEAA